MSHDKLKHQVRGQFLSHDITFMLQRWLRYCMTAKISKCFNTCIFSLTICGEFLPMENSGLNNTYSMKTYVLLHFEDKNDVTVIIKLSYRAMSRRRVAMFKM